MKQIISIISAKANDKQDKPAEQDVVCNYSDNYYGDQVCVAAKDK